MPIDDALKDIEAGEKKKEDSASEETAVKQPEAMWDYARNIIVPVLIDFFNLKLPGQSDNYGPKYSSYLPSFLRAIGLEMLTIKPDVRNTERIFSVNISSLTDEQRTRLIQHMYGDYAFKTDLVEVKDIFTLAELKDVQKVIIDHDAARYIITLNPYLVAMGMNPENRPLAILAIKKAEEDKRITYLAGRFAGNVSVPSTLSKMTPSAKDYLAVAKQYGLKKIMPCINNFKAVCDDYIKNWEN
jgi:hypothetical protein